MHPIPFLETNDSLNEGLMKRYGVPRSEQIASRRFGSVSVGDEHYSSFVPLVGDNRKRMAEMCCDEENVKSSWCTRYIHGSQ